MPLFVLIGLTLLHLLDLFEDVALLKLSFMIRFLKVFRDHLQLLVRVYLHLLHLQLVVQQELLVGQQLLEFSQPGGLYIAALKLLSVFFNQLLNDVFFGQGHHFGRLLGLLGLGYSPLHLLLLLGLVGPFLFLFLDLLPPLHHPLPRPFDHPGLLHLPLFNLLLE